MLRLGVRRRMLCTATSVGLVGWVSTCFTVARVQVPTREDIASPNDLSKGHAGLVSSLQIESDDV